MANEYSKYQRVSNGFFNIQRSGTYHIIPPNCAGIGAFWKSDNITPQGILTFSVQGEPGEDQMPNGVIDFSTDKRSVSANRTIFALDIEAVNIPDGAVIQLVFNQY